MKLLRDLLQILSIKLKTDDERLFSNENDLREEDERNLQLARLFINIKTNSGYCLLGPPKSHLFSREEIIETFLRHGYALDQINAQWKVNELIRKGHISFYYASRGVSYVKIVPYCNDRGDTKFRFEAKFCDDGL